VSLVISGRVVPLAADAANASAERQAFQGKVWIGVDGRIAAVTRGSAKAPPGFDGAPHVDVGHDLVLPGFVDLHSHLAYATLPLWTEPARTTPWAHHDAWPAAKTYAASVTWPAYAFIEAAPFELLAYAEVRALVGGTTSIQGSPPKNRPLDGWMVRNVEDESFGGRINSNQVLSSTLTLKTEALSTRAGKMKSGATFIYHCAEGQPASLVKREYDDVQRCGCLQRGLVAIHTNAIDPTRYGAWTDPGFVVWSPFSNLWLYGTTVDVPAALARGIGVCIGSDWGPSGTRNVLGELKVAQLVNAGSGWKLSSFDLVRMITCVPGDALMRAWSVQAGRLQAGALGDVVVVAAARGADPFDTVLAATEREIRLVVIDGRPGYGDAALMKAARASTPSPIAIAGEARTLSMVRLDDRSQAWSFDAVRDRLEQVIADPRQAIEAAQRAVAARGFDGAAPRFRLALDMPLGRVPIGGLPKDLGDIRVPPLQPLEHDAAFFASIAGRGFHGGLLDGLAGFYH
jgi:cytosine/adenosine deaminase-related metal-dependent hydrolase